MFLRWRRTGKRASHPASLQGAAKVSGAATHRVAKRRRRWRRAMTASDKVFAGSVPEIYDRYLVPLIFEPYARHLAERLAAVDPRHVLETAAGTGVLTRAMASRLSPEARLVVTDLNPPMLEFARARLAYDDRIAWNPADSLGPPCSTASCVA